MSDAITSTKVERDGVGMVAEGGGVVLGQTKLCE